jgi:molecular chaperone GrpE
MPEKKSEASGFDPIGFDPVDSVAAVSAEELPGAEEPAVELSAEEDSSEERVSHSEYDQLKVEFDLLKAEFDRLRTESDRIKAERDQAVERIARLQAEFENARKRAEREKIDFRDYATGSVVEQFLPVLDNFELALKSDGSAEQLRSGVELIIKQMEEVLRQMQVLPIPTKDEPFDPRFHEALGTVERDDLPDQHIAEEIRRGYRLRERLLRPALVRVASNSKQKGE